MNGLKSDRNWINLPKFYINLPKDDINWIKCDVKLPKSTKKWHKFNKTWHKLTNVSHKSTKMLRKLPKSDINWIKCDRNRWNCPRYLPNRSYLLQNNVIFLSSVLVSPDRKQNWSLPVLLDRTSSRRRGDGGWTRWDAQEAPMTLTSFNLPSSELQSLSSRKRLAARLQTKRSEFQQENESETFRNVKEAGTSQSAD